MTVDSRIIAEESQSRFGARRLFRDATSMATSSLAGAALGTGFWILAARLFPPERLGVMTAILSVVTAVGTVASATAGDAYTALLPAAGQSRRAAYRHGQRIFLFTAAAGGVLGGIATTIWLPTARGSWDVAILVGVGTVGYAAFLLQNSTLISLGRARLLPVVTIANSFGKVALLPFLALVLAWGHSLELAFIIPAVLVVVVTRPLVARIVSSGNGLPSSSSIPPNDLIPAFNRLALQTGTISALGLGATALTPFLVTVHAGAAQGALFALALSVVQTLDFLVGAMAVSLVVHASSAPRDSTVMARNTLVRTTVLVGFGAIVLTTTAPTIFGFLNPAYKAMDVVGVVGILGAGSVIRSVYTVWAALQKSRRNMRTPLILNAASATLLFCIVPPLAERCGALGGALAVLVPQLFLTTGAGLHLLILMLRIRGNAGG